MALQKGHLEFILGALTAKGPNGQALLAVPIESARLAADTLDAVQRELAAVDDENRTPAP